MKAAWWILTIFCFDFFLGGRFELRMHTGTSGLKKNFFTSYISQIVKMIHFGLFREKKICMVNPPHFDLNFMTELRTQN